MRVGLFSDYYLAGGDGTAIATRLSRTGLERLGHRVHVFCPATKRRQKQTKGVYSVRSMPGFLYQGLRLSWPFTHRNQLKLKNLRLDIVHIQTPLFIGLWGLWFAKKNAVPLVFTAHLDMDFMDQYIYSAPATFTLGLLTALITGEYRAFSKVIFTHRVRANVRRRQDFAWRMMSFFASQADCVVAPSQKNYQILSHYLDPSKIALVPNGVEIPRQLMPRLVARQKLAIAPDSFVLISTARHTTEKQVDFVIKAFQKLRFKNPNAHLLVLNSGPQTKKLIKLAQERGVERRVHFYGTVAHREVFDYLAAADAFANMCLREVASLGILEAAASGLPLLLRDKRLVEPLQDGLNGYFVKDATQLAKKLSYLASNPAMAQALGQHSKQRVIEKYSLEAHSKALESLYQQLTERD